MTVPFDYAITYVEIAPYATTAKVTPHRTRLELAPSATVAQTARHKTRAEVVPSGETLIIRHVNPDRPWRWDTGRIRFDGGLWTWDGFNNT